MPRLVKLQEEYKEQGFVVIASHRSRIRKDRVIAFLRSVKANFTTTAFGDINILNKLRGVPAAYLFDSTGRLVASGRPAQMKDRIVALLKSEPHWLAAGKKFTVLKSHADALKAAKSYGPIMSRLEQEEEKEGAAQEEARFLLRRLRSYGRKRLRDAKKLEQTDLDQATKEYQEVAKRWQGQKVAEQATERLRELQKSDSEKQK